ncbi:MAG TPA: acetylornithine transaminase [Candidatus Dormibacteraeota bacterium]|nr:acetylornithine transaminase [Candidatus Dormibacteraeota bacterium]
MSDDLKQLDSTYIMPTYKRQDLILEKGSGCYVFDSNGKKYLDFFGGLATCSVGHANPAVTKAITDQAKKLISVSNLYYTEPPVRLAKKLSELSGLKKVFFSHSGADANEAAIKLAKRVTGKKEFIAFSGAFHGRTTGSLALTWSQQYKEPFLPLAPATKFATYNDIVSLESLINDDTAAVIVEPIQGEAGVVVPDENFLRQVRKICTKHHILMIVDEVQTGIGRTGTFFAYSRSNIKPDIVTLAKGLANGVPIGACLSDYELELGEHGSTLGGNSLSCAAANATVDYIEKNNLVKNAETIGDYLMDSLRSLQKTTPLIEDVRGQGLMIGIVLEKPEAARIVKSSMSGGLLCNAAAPNVVRLLPPLIATKEQADECLDILGKALQS